MPHNQQLQLIYTHSAADCKFSKKSNVLLIPMRSLSARYDLTETGVKECTQQSHH